MYKELIRLGYVHPDLRCHLRPFLDSLNKRVSSPTSMGAREDLDDLKATSFLSEWLQENNINPWKAGLGTWLYNHTSDLRSLKRLLTDLKSAPIFSTFRSKGFSEWLSNHPLIDRLIEEVEVKENSSSPYPEVMLDGTTINVGGDLYQKIMKRKGSGTLKRKYEQARENIEEDLSDIRVRGDNLALKNKFSPLHHLKKYIQVLGLLEEVDMVERDMLKPLVRFLKKIDKIGKMELTDDNWEEQFQFIEKMSMTFRDMNKKYLSEMDRNLGLKQGIVDTLKSYVQNTYDKLNSREINYLDDMSRIMQKLPDAMEQATQIL